MKLFQTLLRQSEPSAAPKIRPGRLPHDLSDLPELFLVSDDGIAAVRAS